MQKIGLSAHLSAEGKRRYTRLALEKAGKIGRIGKADGSGHFGHGKFGVAKEPFGSPEPGNVYPGSHAFAGVPSDHPVQMPRRHESLGGIGGNILWRTGMTV